MHTPESQDRVARGLLTRSHMPDPACAALDRRKRTSFLTHAHASVHGVPSSANGNVASAPVVPPFGLSVPSRRRRLQQDNGCRSNLHALAWFLSGSDSWREYLFVVTRVLLAHKLPPFTSLHFLRLVSLAFDTIPSAGKHSPSQALPFSSLHG